MVEMPAKATDTDSNQVAPRNGNANENAVPGAAAATQAVSRLESDGHVEADESAVPAVPDGGWGWMVVLGSFMIHFIADGIAYSFGVFVEDFVDYFDCSKSEVGGLGSLMLGVTWGSGNVDFSATAAD